MKSLDRLFKLADKFEIKLKRQAQAGYGQQQEGGGLTEMFFGDEAKQRAFAAAIQDPKGLVYKTLMANYTKTEQPSSFDLKVSAQPGVSANWVLTVNPPTLKGTVSSALDSVFQKIVGGNMATKAGAATAAVKKTPKLSETQLDIGAVDIS